MKADDLILVTVEDDLVEPPVKGERRPVTTRDITEQLASAYSVVPE